jgi:hypothetical protein
MLAAAVAILLVHTAVGMLGSAAVARAPAGPGFYRMTLLIAVAGLALGFGLRFGPAAASMPPLGTVAAAGYGLSGVGLVIFGSGLHAGARPRFAVLTGAAIAGLLGVAADPVITGSAASSGFGRALYAAGLAGVVPAVGSVLFAMLLAHWYLVEPRMPLAPLQRVLALFAASEALILLSMAGVVAYHWPEWTSMEGGLARAFTLGNALFVAMRAFLGVLAPIGLAWMTWKTVEIRSIQSATGILYAAMVFVLFGETICIYLSLATGQPY